MVYIGTWTRRNIAPWTVRWQPNWSWPKCVRDLLKNPHLFISYSLHSKTLWYHTKSAAQMKSTRIISLFSMSMSMLFFWSWSHLIFPLSFTKLCNVCVFFFIAISYRCSDVEKSYDVSTQLKPPRSYEQVNISPRYLHKNITCNQNHHVFKHID